MPRQLNDLFQSALVFSLAALFGLAFVSDLRQAPAADAPHATMQMAQAAPVAQHA